MRGPLLGAGSETDIAIGLTSFHTIEMKLVRGDNEEINKGDHILASDPKGNKQAVKTENKGTHILYG